MSVNPVNSMSSLSGVSNEDLERMPVEMKWFFVQADRAQSLESLMDDRIDAFRGRTDRIRKLNELKGALQDLEALCSGKKPEDDISDVLNANPELKSRIDQLSADTGVQPFSTSQASAGSAAANSAYLESIPAPPACEIPAMFGTDVVDYLKDEDLRKELIMDLAMDKNGMSSGLLFSGGDEFNEIKSKGPAYRDAMLAFLRSTEADQLAEYLQSNGEGGVTKLTAQIQGGSTSASADSATSGTIQFGQIKSAFTRIDGQINAVSSEQQIDTMQLNSINQQRSACFESMSAALRTWKDLTSTIFR